MEAKADGKPDGGRLLTRLPCNHFQFSVALWPPCLFKLTSRGHHQTVGKPGLSHCLLDYCRTLTRFFRQVRMQREVLRCETNQPVQECLSEVVRVSFQMNPRATKSNRLGFSSFPQIDSNMPWTLRKFFFLCVNARCQI